MSEVKQAPTLTELVADLPPAYEGFPSTVRRADVLELVKGWDDANKDLSRSAAVRAIEALTTEQLAKVVTLCGLEGMKARRLSQARDPTLIALDVMGAEVRALRTALVAVLR